MRRMLATEVHRRLISDSNGRDLRPGGHDLHSRAAPPGSGRFSRRGAAVRAVLCWRRLRRSPSRRRPPGSGLFCRKTGPDLTPFRGSVRLFRFLAAIRVDGCSITPGQKHSHRRCPVPQPTKPPRTLLGRSRPPRFPATSCLRNRPGLCSDVRLPSAGSTSCSLRSCPELCSGVSFEIL